MDIVGNIEHREAAQPVTDVGIEIDPMHYEILAFNRGYPTHLDRPIIEHPANPLPDIRERAIGVIDQAIEIEDQRPN